MQPDGIGLTCTSLSPGEAFFDDLAEHLLRHYPSLFEARDLSSLRVLVPALPMAVELRTALQRAAQRFSRPLLRLLPEERTVLDPLLLRVRETTARDIAEETIRPPMSWTPWIRVSMSPPDVVQAGAYAASARMFADRAAQVSARSSATA